MLRKELLERFHKVEEKVHILAGGLAATFVLTLAVEPFLKEQRSEFMSEMLEWLHKVLLGLDVAIALLLIVGIALRVAGIRRPNASIIRNPDRSCSEFWSECDKWAGNGRAWLPKKSSTPSRRCPKTVLL